MGLELLWRRRTHWTMGLAGGLCAALLYALFAAVEMPFWAAFLCGAAVISAVELVFGLVVNVALGMNVWDYSGVPFNLIGQVCLPYAFLWGVLSILVWGAMKLIA